MSPKNQMATHDLFLQGDLSSDQLVDILAISLNRNTEAQDWIGFFQTIFFRSYLLSDDGVVVFPSATCPTHTSSDTTGFELWQVDPSLKSCTQLTSRLQLPKTCCVTLCGEILWPGGLWNLTALHKSLCNSWAIANPQGRVERKGFSSFFTSLYPPYCPPTGA